MKKKLSITVDEDLIIKLDTLLKDGTFRNKSHVVEQAIKKFVEKEDLEQT